MSIIDLHCQTAGQNKRGSVSDARLTAEGYLCNVNVRLTGGSKWHFPFKIEVEKPNGTISKAHGFLHPDTEDMLESLEVSWQSGLPITVVSVYEYRLLLFLRRTKESELVFERIGVCNCHINDEVVLSEWGREERFTIV
jgi:hypothetical protein